MYLTQTTVLCPGDIAVNKTKMPPAIKESTF